jgi:hypothetical protein
VFVVDGDQVEARSTADGTVRWTMAHEGLIRTNEQVQVGAGPASDAVVTAAMPEDVLTDQFHARDLATGRVLWSALGSDRGLIIAASDKHVVAADLRLFDLHSGHHLAALQVPCLHDPACTLHDSYVQNVALDGTSVVLAVNDFGGA